MVESSTNDYFINRRFIAEEEKQKHFMVIYSILSEIYYIQHYSTSKCSIIFNFAVN